MIWFCLLFNLSFLLLLWKGCEEKVIQILTKYLKSLFGEKTQAKRIFVSFNNAYLIFTPFWRWHKKRGDINSDYFSVDSFLAQKPFPGHVKHKEHCRCFWSQAAVCTRAHSPVNTRLVESVPLWILIKLPEMLLNTVWAGGQEDLNCFQHYSDMVAVDTSRQQPVLFLGYRRL